MGFLDYTKQRWTILAAVFLVFALLATACGGDDGGGDAATSDDTSGDTAEQAATPVSGGKIIYGLAGGTDGWVPAENRWVPSGLTIARSLYDPLAAFDAEGNAKPYLAESLEPNEDFTVWTITVPEGVTFHNGDPLTGEAVAANLESIRGSALLGPTLKGVTDVSVTSPNEVTVTMNDPWATFPVLLAQQVGFIVHPAMLTGEMTDPVGTGPFMFDEWIPGDHMVAIRNENYWRTDTNGEQLPYLNEVEFRVMPQATTRQAALKSGDVDVIHTDTTDDLVDLGRDYQAAEGINVVHSEGGDDEQLIALNSQTGVTDDPTVRKALALATDRTGLNENLFGGFFDVASAPYRSSSKWYTDPGWPEYDLEAAQQLVTEWEAANGPLTIVLSTISVTEDLEIAQALQEMWQQAGIDVEIDALEESVFVLNIVTGDYEAAVFKLFNAPDPDGDYHFWDPSNVSDPGTLSLAITRYQNEEMRVALIAARGTTDEATRIEEYAKVWKKLAEGVPLIWLFHAQWVVEARDNVHGLDAFTLPDGSPGQLMNWGSIFLTQAWVE